MPEEDLFGVSDVFNCKLMYSLLHHILMFFSASHTVSMKCLNQAIMSSYVLYFKYVLDFCYMMYRIRFIEGVNSD